MKKLDLVQEDTYEVVTQLAMIDIPAFLLIFSVATLFQVDCCRQITVGLALINLLLGSFLVVAKYQYDRKKNHIEDVTLF